MSWSPDFFAGDWLEAQRAFTPPERASRLAEQIAGRLDLRRGSRVLDVPCGHGPLALALAEHGCDVTGVDLCAPLVEEARAQAAARGLALDLQVGDMRALPWVASFDALVCWWSSVGFFDDAGEEAQFAGFARALRPGGRLLVETLTLETLGPQPQRVEQEQVSQVAGFTIREAAQVDWIAGRVRTRWRFERGGVVTSERTSDMRLYSCAQLVERLRQAGFDDFQAHADLDGRPFGLGRRLLLVAQRV
jgi:cyclopropane fatty-acyl-phospholipid synthase-like methyltransferase